MSDGPAKPKSTSLAIQGAALFGALIGAFLARPVLKPWMDQHASALTFARGWSALASFVPWIVFSIYWEIEKKNSAPVVSSETKFSRAIHVALSNAALLLVIMPIRGLNQGFLPDLLIVKLIGLAFECAGLTLAIWARRVLGRNWSGEITIKADHELIRNGPYATVRHPIYTALLAMYAGTAIVSGQMHALAGLVIAILAYLRKTRLEEANLAHAFGEQYTAYRNETWAIVPKLGKPQNRRYGR
ncbi:isoprenylcysteine carboxylmethyltransferase family protein [Telmatobacter sp. DSM 110680]|uniref:Isoprenylcysteine carboxylmethyltransferase family protein n=1 Tax=Telmatobacter sp. DSM 110680 TaxID=3036704 RepID=A0AAU7DII3_9BACT